MKLKSPSCPHGYTHEDLAELFTAEELDEFMKWMCGQTVMVCEGRRYDHEKERYEPDECAGNPHGMVIYTWDVRRYIDHHEKGTPLIWD